MFPVLGLSVSYYSSLVYECRWGRCTSNYYGETERHLKVKSGEHIRISPLTFKETKPFTESSMNNHHLQCDKNPSLDEFTNNSQE